MKKTYYLLLFMLLLTAVAHAQNAWTTKKLDEKLSVKFPEEPQKETKNGIDIYILRAADSTLYSATLMDYKVIFRLDSTGLAQIKDTQRFADQMKQGIASQKLNYTFGDIKIGKWKTFTTYHFNGTENTGKGKLWIQMILIGSKMYTFSCRVPVNLATKNDEIFFKSTEILNQ